MIEQIIPAREASLVGDMKVRRVLPFRARRMVGPFVFLDEMGPLDLRAGSTGDVPPHPHIGLSTVTYLFEGEILHRDSLGTRQTILPGDVNWMTAGSGIVHSERIPERIRSGGFRLYGLQAWVALPLEAEEIDPSFEHYPRETLPRFEIEGVDFRLIAGEAFGRTSPVKTHSKLFYFDARLPEGKSLHFDPGMQESAFYLLSGQIRIDDQSFDAPVMITFRPGMPILVSATRNSHGVFLGGAPLEAPRRIWWNFVSSSMERIENAKRRWRNQDFPRVPDETEFVPLPEGS